MTKSIKNNLSFPAKIFSYFNGREVEKIISPINGELKIYLINGRYLLNAKDTNYSYGELHTGFQKIFRKMKLKSRYINKVLLLGLGVGSVVSIIQEELKINCSVVAIEKDPMMIDLGHKYFKISRFQDIQINICDAFDFMMENKKKFDLIVFDIYINNEIPTIFETSKFLFLLKQSLSSNGLLIFNKAYNSKKMLNTLSSLDENFKTVFGKYQKLQVVKNNYYYVYESS